ncbi:nicotinate-nucleotide adenylyltransferase [Megasphaera vaginalis (ex Srinivasan et al. 2021)]|uniref:Probable nicotinate-nucleotide adenylyltransferase n=1 Tax=Megasphaera vaginalis (ex Srinivasan et al. 2021) TaxID=1111454 RepID=U7UHQ1_9FIRM|nr:nicotinate-nucleotide adenylyltransferase [Megasphaera vaginalis (ex Srinivasan et al. 2021)]ERT58419.1 nicotinate-nucleotide adenylyltransferase [Megasphaera vaginalis (ex Srinivasan et al. 2021)]
METTRLGIMGGTFNPIHFGHLLIAEEARQQLHLDRILFIPSYATPNKDICGATAEERLAMVRLAVDSNPHFVVSDMEIRRKGPSYTVDTLRLLRTVYGKDSGLYFISGTDTIHDLPNWHKPEDVLRLCYFVGASRPDGTEEIEPIITKYGDLGCKIIPLAVPELEISSTEVRRRLQAGLSVRYMIPDNVADFIYKNGVYQCVHKK